MKGFESFHERFRARLRLLREARGLRQADLEDHGVPLRTYQQVELGIAEPKLSTLFAIASAFGVEPDELLRVRDVDPSAAKVGRGGYRPAGKPASRSVRTAPRRRTRRS